MKPGLAQRVKAFAVKRFFVPLADALRQEQRGRLAPLWADSLVVWLAVLLATPFLIWVVGEQVFPRMVTLGVLAQAAATLLALACRWPARRLAGLVAVVLPATWVVEKIGITTGWPFGHYAYTQALQPQLAGVPALIPFGWLMMLAPAWAVVDALLPSRAARPGWRYHLCYAVLSGLAFMAWDLYMDPQMVARRLWLWEEPSGYFGIPWTNLVGWWCSATLLTLLVRPRELPRLRLLIIYSLTWLFQAIGVGIFWGQPGPALCGFLAMGLLAVLAWRQEMGRW